MHKIFYFIGQPGSGKTTISKKLIDYLDDLTYHIDGDDIREIFNNKDYSEEGRRKNIQRAQDIARFLSRKDTTVVMSLVSPYKDLRDEFKKDSLVIEIYLHTTEDRGRNHFHVDNYEPPTENYIDIDTTNKTEEETFDILIKKLFFM